MCSPCLFSLTSTIRSYFLVLFHLNLDILPFRSFLLGPFFDKTFLKGWLNVECSMSALALIPEDEWVGWVTFCHVQTLWFFLFSCFSVENPFSISVNGLFTLNVSSFITCVAILLQFLSFGKLCNYLHWWGLTQRGAREKMHQRLKSGQALGVWKCLALCVRKFHCAECPHSTSFGPWCHTNPVLCRTPSQCHLWIHRSGHISHRIRSVLFPTPYIHSEIHFVFFFLDV